MDYEEKLKTIINSNKTPFVDIDTFLKYFPELKESEDERIRKELIAIFKGQIPFTSEEDGKRYIAWLEKQGEQTPAWSEEDEVMLKEALRMIESPGSIFKGEILTKKVITWLKSLKPQNRWKPSGEQMHALEYYMHTLTCNEYKEILFGLYTDLQKLKGE